MTKIVFLFYNGMTALDAIGPYEVLSRLPGAETTCAAEKSGPIKTEQGLTFTTEYSIHDIQQADILCIPGAGNATSLSQYPDILKWIKKIHETTAWTTSVCTGSLILGAAGILKDKRATTHWSVMDRLSHWSAIPENKRVVEDGKIITAAGVSAGIDMALTLAAKIAGIEVAEALQLGLEYDPAPPYNSGSPEKAKPELVAALKSKLLTKFETL